MLSLRCEIPLELRDRLTFILEENINLNILFLFVTEWFDGLRYLLWWHESGGVLEFSLGSFCAWRCESGRQWCDSANTRTSETEEAQFYSTDCCLWLQIQNTKTSDGWNPEKAILKSPFWPGLGMFLLLEVLWGSGKKTGWRSEGSGSWELGMIGKVTSVARSPFSSKVGF